MTAPYDTLALHGYSPWSAERILRAVDAGTPIADLPGDFTLIATGGTPRAPRAKLVSSLVAARPYYLARAQDGTYVHGPTVFDVVRKGRLGWRWNHRAVNSLALLGHTAGEDSLHPDVTRVPCASVVTIEGDRARVDRHDRAWSDVFAGARDGRLDQAAEGLEVAFREMSSPDAVVSLSAGFDSRLLLALALRAGQRPLALTMGFASSTDVQVARQIARSLGLEHRVVELQAADYLRHARAIVETTSGTKTAANWHTDLYARAAGLSPGTVHYVGSNGEFARTFFVDAGVAALVADRAPSRLAEAYLAARFVRRARRFPRALLANGPDALACARHAAALPVRLTERFLDALDCFYATVRARHFIGNGLALYAAHGAPRSPFLDARWIRAVARLPRADRLGSNFHRHAIAAAWPALLCFPVGAEPAMARRAPPLYALRRPRIVGYSPFAAVAADSATRELIIEASSLDGLLDRRARLEAVERYPAAIELLLTLAVAGELGQVAAASATRETTPSQL